MLLESDFQWSTEDTSMTDKKVLFQLASFHHLPHSTSVYHRGGHGQQSEIGEKGFLARTRRQVHYHSVTRVVTSNSDTMEARSGRERAYEHKSLLKALRASRAGFKEGVARDKPLRLRGCPHLLARRPPTSVVQIKLILVE